MEEKDPYESRVDLLGRVLEALARAPMRRHETRSDISSDEMRLSAADRLLASNANELQSVLLEFEVLTRRGDRVRERERERVRIREKEDVSMRRDDKFS